MRLLDLQPQFLSYREENDGQRRVFHRWEVTIGEAHGVMFKCPRCWRDNGGPVGTHSIVCWSPSVPDNATPGPGRWTMMGTGLGDLSLVAGSSSVQLHGGCRWHGFVRNGEVIDA